MPRVELCVTVDVPDAYEQPEHVAALVVRDELERHVMWPTEVQLFADKILDNYRSVLG